MSRGFLFAAKLLGTRPLRKVSSLAPPTQTLLKGPAVLLPSGKIPPMGSPRHFSFLCDYNEKTMLARLRQFLHGDFLGVGLFQTESYSLPQECL